MINSTIRVLVISIIILGTQFKVKAQEQQSGIYFLREADKNCPYSITDENKTKSYCTGADPIILLKEFESISEVYQGEITSFFEVYLKTNGQKKFKSILVTKVTLKLGLINKGELLGIIDTQEGNIYNKFRVYAPSNSDKLELIRNNLLALLKE